MDTLPLPPRPSLEHYKKRAKELAQVSRSSDPDALRAWVAEWLAALARALGIAITSFEQESFERAVEQLERGVREKLNRAPAGSGLALADAQFFLARAHSFESWAAFARHVEGLLPGANGDPFERAADAVVGGDLAALQELVRVDDALIRARSARTHRATLLHYVAANGVEDFRQRTPPNAVQIAKFLLESGAEVDAVASTYGGGKAQTTMNLLVSSSHPADAGLQVPLLETLLDFGAAIDGLEDNGSHVMTALAFGYANAAEALARRGARIDNVPAAAGLGRVELVRGLLDANVAAPLVGLDWLGLARDRRAQLERALVWAAAYGHTPVVELLLARGVDPAAKDPQGNTGLHWAGANGYRSVVELLIARGAPLESRNDQGQTALAWTVQHALRWMQYWSYYSAVIEMLVAAGADVRAVSFPTGNELVDELLQRHGARAS